MNAYSLPIIPRATPNNPMADATTPNRPETSPSATDPEAELVLPSMETPDVPAKTRNTSNSSKRKASTRANGRSKKYRGGPAPDLSKIFGWTPSVELKKQIQRIARNTNGDIDLLAYAQHYNWFFRNDFLFIGRHNVAGLPMPVWMRVKLTASNSQTISLCYDATDGTEFPGGYVTLPITYPSQNVEELLGSKMTERDSDIEALEVYLKGLYYIIHFFICLRKEMPDDGSSGVIQYGTGWKHPFWRFEESRGTASSYVLNRLKNYLPLERQDMLFPSKFDVPYDKQPAGAQSQSQPTATGQSRPSSETTMTGPFFRSDQRIDEDPRGKSSHSSPALTISATNGTNGDGNHLDISKESDVTKATQTPEVSEERLAPRPTELPSADDEGLRNPIEEVIGHIYMPYAKPFNTDEGNRRSNRVAVKLSADSHLEGPTTDAENSRITPDPEF